ncbi:hypothetical protein CKO_01348 [Citrobacter koseri ATCC BAA-895]|uniref:Uncharacterized protein n=1 Tax=Citrobacter koseri (strain ATCC BAA-895 / CDC 4225-83 / SGSC4696) TaxID=290338 RepID=A8AG72_CITK8|nr:hypothetical protein CKO_01348 [Citrobacter koseri ATCC BAA-895]
MAARTKTADVKLSLPGGANAYRAYGLFCRPDKEPGGANAYRACGLFCRPDKA